MAEPPTERLMNSVRAQPAGRRDIFPRYEILEVL